MIYITNECCGCATENYPCIGSACPLRRVVHYECDQCKDEVDEGELYYFDGEQLCIECIKGRLDRVEEVL